MKQSSQRLAISLPRYNVARHRAPPTSPEQTRIVTAQGLPTSTVTHHLHDRVCRERRVTSPSPPPRRCHISPVLYGERDRSQEVTCYASYRR